MFDFETFLVIYLLLFKCLPFREQFLVSVDTSFSDLTVELWSRGIYTRQIQ